jgi:hypothetical protein
LIRGWDKKKFGLRAVHIEGRASEYFKILGSTKVTRKVPYPKPTNIRQKPKKNVFARMNRLPKVLHL